jgi:hypothetical protein
MWYQELLLPLHDILPDGQACSGLPAEDLKIRVFSEVIRVNNDDTAPEKPTTRTVVRRLLAHTCISLASIRYQQPLKAIVQLKVPPAILGHHVPQVAPRLAFFGAVQGVPAPIIHSSVPALTPHFTATSESAALVARVQQWQAKVALIQATQSRCIDALVCNLQGMGTCLTRFVAAVTVPPLVQQQMMRMQQRCPATVRLFFGKT